MQETKTYNKWCNLKMDTGDTTDMTVEPFSLSYFPYCHKLVQNRGANDLHDLKQNLSCDFEQVCWIHVDLWLYFWLVWVDHECFIWF